MPPPQQAISPTSGGPRTPPTGSASGSESEERSETPSGAAAPSYGLTLRRQSRQFAKASITFSELLPLANFCRMSQEQHTPGLPEVAYPAQGGSPIIKICHSDKTLPDIRQSKRLAVLYHLSLAKLYRRPEITD